MTTTLTAVVQAAQGRVLLTLTWTTVTQATITRIHPDGTRWPVRAANPALVASTTGVGWTGYDAEAPLDVAVTYTASSTQDPATFSATPVTVPSDTGMVGSMAWLTHPLQPSLSVLFAVSDIAAQTRVARRAVLPIMGSSLPVAVSDVRLAPTGELTGATLTAADAAALAALIADGATLLVRCPATWGSMWFYAAIGDVTDENPTRVGPQPDREWKLPYTVVAAPVGVAGGSLGDTYNDVLTAYATYNALLAGEATYNALLTQPGP